MRHDLTLSLSLPLAVVVASASLATPAEGSLVRYDFTGRITAETPSGPSALGREFTGTLIYDDAIPLGESHEDPWGKDERSYASGTFRPADPAPDGTMLQLWFDGEAVAPESGGLSGGLFTSTWGDGSKHSELVFQSEARDEDGRLSQGGLSIVFKVDPTMLASGRFPDGLSVADLPDVSVAIDSVLDGQYRGDVAGGLHYGGSVDSFQFKPVPEPSWTVAALLAAAAWTVRRRSASGRATADHRR